MFHDNESDQPEYPNSPLMKPQQVQLTKQSPTPPPVVTTSPPTFESGDDKRHSDAAVVAPTTRNDAYLLQYLDSSGRNSHITTAKGSSQHHIATPGPDRGTPGVEASEEKPTPQAQASDKHPSGSAGRVLLTPVHTDLENLAAKALAVANPQAQSPGQSDCALTTSTRKLSLHEGASQQSMINLSPSDHHTERSSSAKSPSLLTPGSTGSAGLPPISPGGSESMTQSLPPLRFHLEDMKLPLPDQDVAMRHHTNTLFSQASPDGHQLPPMAVRHGSPQPPLSPPDSYTRSLPSPFSATSPYAVIPTGTPHRPSADFGIRPTPAPGAIDSGPNHDQIPFAPAIPSAYPADRMRIDGITNPQPGYICTFNGCTAPPFQTQYLLNSHTNVHSSNRPHYCPVPGCSRSEGGKGFKRKNEMIRHGLVHDSPGYICPFCPDRDHRYPRPDNLQRHVRVHHVDKSKDDPQLREVLAQRAEGPHRGRRRRGGPP